MNLRNLRNFFGGNSEVMMQLGILMRKGIPMAEALHRISQTATSQSLRRASAVAARRLSSGEGSDKVFAASEMAAFPSAVRYVLAAPLKDETRGMLIADMQLRPHSGIQIESALFYPVISLAWGMMTVLAMFMFVLPQMREIFLGLKIQGSSFVTWLFGFSSDGSFLYMVILLAIFAVIIQLVIFMSRRLGSFSKKTDEMNLLRMLAVVPREERVLVIDVMAVKHNFPALHSSFRRMARALADGMDISSASREAGVSDGLAWFVALGLHDKKAGSPLLLQAYDYYNADIKNSNEKTVTMIEVANTAFLSVVFGSLAYALTEMMNAICIGTMQ
ncbi:MAG: hypothetical protein CVV42_15395 [Candidatus Riflebacteria bacterium HGW-Riflebacteria-2]|jgi:type II secretory pathway component PulF|nr:MAG: hypothetical protein CVV42_15395 [Candidatus Riflebacteria bacterium HGW-Riflebacteria-2]